MPVILMQMNREAYNSTAHPTGTSPIAFKQAVIVGDCSSVGSANALTHSHSHSNTSMNFSARLSRKPSSLSSSRNISIQKLSLNNTFGGLGSLQQSPRRGKSLALCIPSNTSPTTLGYAENKMELQTPVRKSSLQSLPMNDKIGRSGNLETEIGTGTGTGTETETETEIQDFETQCGITLRSPFKSSPDILPDPGDSLTKGLLNLSVNEGESEPCVSRTDRVQTDSYHARPNPCTNQAVSPKSTENTSKSLLVTATEPEELQEVGFTYAYPKGPANVLNSRVYLYCDPNSPGHSVDINAFDLVVNVARECADLSDDFDDKNGTKKYLHVPWSHTSAISNELPMITKEIAAMDQPGKRILVHCQCGVSRSACVVVAYFMVKFNISVNDAYELLKSGTANLAEDCSQKIKNYGNHVDACERICPNMSLIFELMEFGDKLEKKDERVSE